MEIEIVKEDLMPLKGFAGKYESKIPFVDFLASRNSVYVSSEEDFNYLMRMLDKIKISSTHLISSWKDLTKISGFKGYACMEYNNDDGLGYFLDIKENHDWYGKKPITMVQIINGKY